MPAMLDDPDSPTIYRSSGAAPYPDPHDPNPTLPDDIGPRQVTLRDRVTVATIVPFSSHHQVPSSLLQYLGNQFNTEIEKGDTYPLIDAMSHDKFSSYWFQNFGAVMLLGDIEAAEDVVEGRNWATECLGSFYIKPNYPGRSSHVCNAGFLVTDAARNRGVGRLMGETYIDWAPKLGYTYSVFNLVYETNVASCRIWDALGFKRIGRVKGCGNLKSYPGQLIDALIYGRDLGPEGEDFVSEERFDKIKFYLKTGKYPNGADRAEKSRLRSAATHYKLLEGDKLMLKDKEVISDPQRQYEIARQTHGLTHAGINKTTAMIAESYHWVRIKETVSLVIRNCTECKELGKMPPVRPTSLNARQQHVTPQEQNVTSHSLVNLSNDGLPTDSHSYEDPFSDPSSHLETTSVLDQSLQTSVQRGDHSSLQHQHHQQMHHSHLSPSDEDYLPLDPQIMEDVRTHLGGYNSHSHAHSQNHDSNSISKYDTDSYGTHQGHHSQDMHTNFLHSSMLVSDDHSHHPRLGNHSQLQHHGVDLSHESQSQSHIVDDGVDGDLDMLIQDDDEGIANDVADEQIKARAQAAARAAEAAMRGDAFKDQDDVGGFYGGFRDG